MKKKSRIWIPLFLLIGIVITLVFSCENDNNIIPDNPTNGKTTAIFNPNKIYGTLTDQDGNVYKTITIGSQTWMAENLRTRIYRNGGPIPEVTDSLVWAYLSTGGYCNYNYTSNIDTIATYGRLYNWYAVNDDRNIAPEGWHVATNEEWMTLVNYLQGDTIAGGMLKEAGTTHWNNPNIGATNESGFTALPGGYKYAKWVFAEIGMYGYWWTASEGNEIDEFAWHVHLCSCYILVGGCECPKNFGYSVRCVKD